MSETVALRSVNNIEPTTYYLYSISSDGSVEIEPYIVYNGSLTLAAHPQTNDVFMGHRMANKAWSFLSDSSHLQSNPSRCLESQRQNNTAMGRGSDPRSVFPSPTVFDNQQHHRKRYSKERINKRQSIRTQEFYRVPYTDYQKQMLETSYAENKFLKSSSEIDLIRKTNLNAHQIKIWFQNRRAKDRKNGIRIKA